MAGDGMSAQHFDSSGPAFPVSTTDWRRGHQSGVNEWQFPGMSLRDYFAAKAMQSLIIEGAGHNAHPGQIGPQCGTAYDWADAMLRAREVQS